MINMMINFTCTQSASIQFLQYPLLSNSTPRVKISPHHLLQPNQFNGKFFLLFIQFVIDDGGYIYIYVCMLLKLHTPPTSNWIQIFFSRSNQNASHNKECLCHTMAFAIEHRSIFNKGFIFRDSFIYLYTTLLKLQPCYVFNSNLWFVTTF